MIAVVLLAFGLLFAIVNPDDSGTSEEGTEVDEETLDPEASRQYYTVEHMHRLIVAVCILAGTTVWLLQDGFQGYDLLVFICFFLGVLVDQLKGYMCHRIEKMLHYAENHNDYE